ncbi:LCN15 protein, partial [Centropus bengalensis]|nr:LCN15 protein [Centropus bengalensis]
VDTDYSSYAIMYELQQSGQEPSTSLQLLTRGKDVSPELLQKFKQLFSAVHLTEDMLAILPETGECQGGTG